MLALRTLENLLEEVTQAEWDDIDERIAALKLPAGLLRSWPDARLSGDVREQNEPVPGKRITLSLQPRIAVRERVLTITTWIFRSAKE